MKQRTTKAIVLKRVNFGEADRIVTLLTSDYGKIRIIAKGVRKLKSKLAGGLELLSVTDITYIVGKSDIYTLVSSRLDTHYENIVKDIDRTMQAYDCIKLIDKIIHDHSGEEFFRLLQGLFLGLNDLSIDVRVVRVWFRMLLLTTMGYGLNLETDTNDNKLRTNNTYTFDFENMAFAASINGKYVAQHIKIMRFLRDRSTITDVGKLTGFEDYIDKVSLLTQQLIKRQVD